MSTPKTDRVLLVVTCAQRKTQPVPASLRLGSVPGVRLATRFRNWTERLSDTAVPATPASSLYAGEHWDVARRLNGTRSAGIPVELWVCSAGYGLIPADASIVPYAATFAGGDPDSVPDGIAGAAAWWDALSGWEGPAPRPRSLARLVAHHPSARILLALSASYLKACRTDIGRATRHLKDVKQLSIISGGTASDDELDQFLLPCDARLQNAVGGTRQGLNVRVAGHLLSTGTLAHDAMAKKLNKVLAKQPALVRYERQRSRDAEVRAFIRARRKVDPSVTHTRLLREFRADNRACEQSRFKALFEAETGVKR